MKPAKINDLDDHVSGDTWQGISAIGPVLCGPNGTDPMPYAAASCRLWFTREGSKTVSLRLASATASDYAEADGPINIMDAAAWSFSVPKVTPEVWAPAPGNYSGHFEVTDINGDTLTIYDIVLTVLKDKTPKP